MRAIAPNHLTVRQGEPFEIALPEPGATGYLYEPYFDPDFVSFGGVKRAISPHVGGENLAIFHFTARQIGKSDIWFRLTAPWDPQPAGEKHVCVDVGS